jgi:alkylhydroperoxidase family enzyme
MFLRSPVDNEAIARLYQSDVTEQQGFVMNLSRLWAWRPEVCEAFGALRTQLTGNSTLSNRELAVIVCATAASLGDSYCALAWGKKLAAAADPSAAAAVLQGSENDGLTARDQALSVWARKVARNPNATTPQDVEALARGRVFRAGDF